MKKSVINTILAAAVAAVAGSATASVHAVGITIPLAIGVGGPSVEARGTGNKFVYARGRRLDTVSAQSEVFHLGPLSGTRPIYSLSVRVTCGSSNYSKIFQGNGTNGSARETCAGRGNYVSASGNVSVLN